MDRDKKWMVGWIYIYIYIYDGWVDRLIKNIDGWLAEKHGWLHG